MLSSTCVSRLRMNIHLGKIWGQKDNKPANGFHPTTQRRAWLKDHSNIIALLILVASFFFYLYNIEGWLINDDEGNCLYAAWRLSEGEIPYNDFLSAKAPLFLYIGAFIMKMFGASALALCLASRYLSEWPDISR
jgi:hypothetical protein